MTKQAKRVVAVLALAAVLSSAAASGAEKAAVNALSKWVPAESLLFIAYDGNNPASKKTALHDILNEPEMKALLDGPLAALKKLIAAEALKKGGPDTDLLLPLLNTKIGLAFIGLAPPADEMMPPEPEIMLVVEVGKPDSAASKAVRLLVDYLIIKAGLPPDAFGPANVHGIAAETANIGPTTITYATTNGYFVLGTGQALSKALDANVKKLADTKEFQRVSKITGGNEVLLFHFAYASYMQEFGPMIPPDVRQVLTGPEFGLANLKSISVSVAPDGKGIKGTVFLRVPGGRKGILKQLAGKALDPAIVKLAPKRAEFFYAASLDPGKLWDLMVAQATRTPAEKQEAERELAKVKEKLGFDLRQDFVASLGDEFAVFAPSLGAVAKLKDPAKFKTCLDALLAKAAEAAGRDLELRGVQLKLATMQYKGRTITYVDGKGFPLFFQPCYMLVGDYTVFALFPATLKGYILEMAGGENLTDNADFKALRSKIPAGASSIYYADTKAFLSELYGFLPIAIGCLKMVPDEYQALCPDPAKVPPLELVSKHLFGCTAGCRPVADGVLWESYSPIGLPTPPAFRRDGGTATMAILAGILVPALSQARDEARKVKDANNLRQIGIAANLWLNVRGDLEFYPPSLKALLDDEIFKEPKVFISPAGDTKLVEGKFVTDYECILDLVGRKVSEAEAAASLPLAWDKKGMISDGRNVVFFDSHVEFMSEERFQQLKKQVIDPWVAKHKPKAKPEPEKAAPKKELEVEKGLDDF